ncbi:MAG: ankyrin repeat domain-containing protein [Planctomycetes bacterium]|nr:ankyrin repeat domain-containing protein [Planctomycetota bacterium]
MIGADPNARNEYGYTYLALACYQPNVEIVEKLIKKPSSLKLRRNRSAAGL